MELGEVLHPRSFIGSHRVGGKAEEGVPRVVGRPGGPEAPDGAQAVGVGAGPGVHSSGPRPRAGSSHRVGVTDPHSARCIDCRVCFPTLVSSPPFLVLTEVLS